MRFGPRRGTHHAAQGATALESGRTFESELDATHRAYEGIGLAVIARAHPPVGGPPHALFYKGKGQVDYVGHVCGVPVAFDAKSNRDQASYKQDPRDMHELDFLLAWRGTGGVAFLLLVDRPAGTLYLVDALRDLRQGASVPLRTHARGKSLPVPVVPALFRTESERLLDTALGRPVWPWHLLAGLHDPRIAAAVAAHAHTLPPAA